MLQIWIECFSIVCFWWLSKHSFLHSVLNCFSIQTAISTFLYYAFFYFFFFPVHRLSPGKAMSLYDSYHLKKQYQVSVCRHDSPCIVTHSSYWTYKKEKERAVENQGSGVPTSKPAEVAPSQVRHFWMWFVLKKQRNRMWHHIWMNSSVSYRDVHVIGHMNRSSTVLLTLVYSRTRLSHLMKFLIHSPAILVSTCQLFSALIWLHLDI